MEQAEILSSKEAYEPYAQKRGDLLDELKKFAHEEFK